MLFAQHSSITPAALPFNPSVINSHIFIWCLGFFFSVLLYYFLIIALCSSAFGVLIFVSCSVANRKMLCVFFSCAVSQSHRGADSRGRSTLSQTRRWQVSTLAVCVYIRKVVVFVCLLMFLPYFLVTKLNYAVDEGPYRYI